MIHLDTSFLIRALIPGTEQDRSLREWMRRYEPLAMSTIAWTEFLCGPIDPEPLAIAAQLIPERVAFQADDAHMAAQLFNGSGRRRGSLTDCMIAASAVRANARIATVNAEDFQRFASFGLRLAQ